MRFNLNVGVFVPKSHTPYQWAAQMDEDEARRKLEYIRSRLKPLGHRVSFNDPFIALAEGFLSRGGEDAADIIEEAYRRGCRLDAWDDYMKKEVWGELLGPRRAGILGERDMTKALPWDMIQSGSENEYFRNELTKSKNKEITSPCMEFCNHNCGICGKDCGIVENNIHTDSLHDGGVDGGPGSEQLPEQLKEENDNAGNRPPSGLLTFRLLFSFSKGENALFYSHLTMVEIFSMAMIRAGIPVSFTRGFNPQPRMEFASPLAMGIEAHGEIAMIETGAFIEGEQFIKAMNLSLPRGIRILDAENYTIGAGQKKHSLSSLLWGFSYRLAGGNGEFVPAADEKKFRAAHYMNYTDADGNFPLRLAVLARDPGDHTKYGSYFKAYRIIYPS
jgi:hypothetical protein